MSNFKIGEKVGFKHPGENASTLDGFKYPSDKEILLIIGVCENDPDAFKIKGYETDYKGRNQFFMSWDLRKLDHDFAENLLKEISEAMKSETILN